MITQAQALGMLPQSLRDPLIDEYKDILSNYSERRWRASELSGGRFCEIVYTVIHGTATNSYASAPTKPTNFLKACQDLENQTGLSRGLRILIPRLLPALYEIRNNRNVGHVGGDVDPHQMDAKAVVDISSWVMAELVRSFHQIRTSEAQSIVNSLAVIRNPIIWQSGIRKRVLDTKLKINQKILLLLTSEAEPISVETLMNWLKYDNESYLLKILKSMDKECLIDFDEQGLAATILPPGAIRISEEIKK
jgi:hypothetical protein